jgi:hypothetical protein
MFLFFEWGDDIEEREQAFRWMRDINNKSKRHIDKNRWLTMYFEIGCIAFECIGDKGSLDEARLCFMKLDRGVKVVRKSRYGSLPDPLVELFLQTKYYNDRIPIAEECMRRGGAVLVDISGSGEVTSRYIEKQETEI